MTDTRLTQTQLDAAVDFAYGGAAYRTARRQQARTISCFFRRLTGQDRAAAPGAGAQPRGA